MQEKYYIRKWELFFIVLNIAIYKNITGYSRIFAHISGSAAPLSAIFSGLITFLIIWLLLSLYERHQNKTILDIAEASLGKWAKYMLFIILFAYLVFSSAINLRETGEFIKAVSFPSAPLAFVFFIIMGAAVLCCAQGFDAIGRAHCIVIPFIFIAILIITFFSFSNGEKDNLFPVLGYGAESVFIKGLSSIGLYGDFIILFMLAPFKTDASSFKTTALGATATGIAVNILMVIAYTATAPYTVLPSVIHPFHQLIKLFSIGQMLGRTDGYFMYIMAACGILSIALNIFFASFSAGRVLGLPKTRPLSYPLGIIITLFALTFHSRETAYLGAVKYLPICCLIIFGAAALILALPKKETPQ